MPIQADLEQQVNTLQTTAAAAKTAADDALAVARRELKQTQERHASDRSAWHKDRRERDARIADVTTQAAAARTELDGLRRSLDEERQALKNARAEIERMADERRSELAARDAVQADLERQVQATAASQRDLEIALVAARTALTDAEATHAAAWSSWEAARQQFEKDLETRVGEARAAAAANSDLEAQLTADTPPASSCVRRARGDVGCCAKGARTPRDPAARPADDDRRAGARPGDVTREPPADLRGTRGTTRSRRRRAPAARVRAG